MRRLKSLRLKHQQYLLLLELLFVQSIQAITSKKARVGLPFICVAMCIITIQRHDTSAIYGLGVESRVCDLDSN